MPVIHIDACPRCEGTGRGELIVHPQVGLMQEQCPACGGTGRAGGRRRGWTPEVIDGGLSKSFQLFTHRTMNGG